ncbi:MAG: hypothetical protein A2X56_11410 [Nitrospirae bacterium GWC2_57_13]|nr:MAG: hypothetical protein A2X56_11410 [Nitrospirae bacterium GWC2_57_13]OGW42536.1 MAG: hypothetical protein A2X57_01540 [Nitrospirae bacterium GWD2_57_8]
MRGYRKILIAVNGSTDVLRQGLKLAQDEKTWVTVVKVIPPFEGDLDLTSVKNIGDALDSGGGKAVSEIRDIANQEGALIKTRLEQGGVPEKIMETAEEERCDLIVIGARKTSSRSWLRRLIGDNTVEKVISGAPCPVLVVSA